MLGKVENLVTLGKLGYQLISEFEFRSRQSETIDKSADRPRDNPYFTPVPIVPG